MATEKQLAALKSFKPGQSGNPGGKPVGARDAIGAAFLKRLAADFNKHGEQALKDLRTQRPDKYIEVIASLLPAEKNVSVNGKIAHEHVAVSAADSIIRDAIESLENRSAPPSLPN